MITGTVSGIVLSPPFPDKQKITWGTVQMRILLSNDDGYFAPGLQCLAEALSTIA